MTDDQRLIGRLEAHVEQLRKQVDEQDKKLDTILALVEQGKGARMAVAVVSSVIGGLTGFVAAVLGVVRGS